MPQEPAAPELILAEHLVIHYLERPQFTDYSTDRVLDRRLYRMKHEGRDEEEDETIAMTKQSHDHNFKNLFQDFPREALELFYPRALELYGKLIEVSFVRQEPRKHQLSDAGLDLDMPVLFRFERGELLLWLVEFQEDKGKFSIYKLLRYTTDLMEAHPHAVVVPTVLFTDRKDWRKDVPRMLDNGLAGRTFVHFEYVCLRLFALEARDYYTVNNPVAKILMPKMQYPPSERLEVLRRAYLGLYQLASKTLFAKYVDFIDIYAQVQPEEQQALCAEIMENKETAMLAQYIKDMGRDEGMLFEAREMVNAALGVKFSRVPENISGRLGSINNRDILKELHKKAILCDSLEQFEQGLDEVAGETAGEESGKLL